MSYNDFWGNDSGTRDPYHRGDIPGGFTNPIGRFEQRFTPLPGDETAITGAGGDVRHNIALSPDNPYGKQLKLARNNKDIDALYAQAIEWEADRANTLENREYARSVLEEQRAYDDPTNQVARQRAAGINPDLAGSGGSGGISSGSAAQEQQQSMADQQAQVKYSNVYDNTAMVFDGINASANLISSLSGAGSSIVSGISQMRQLPTQIALGESQAGLADATASEINKMLPVKEGLGKTQQALGIAQTGLASSQSVMNRLSTFSQLKTLASPEASDDDLTSLLGAIGVGADEIAPIVQGYRTYEKSPELQAYQSQVEDNRRRNEARNDVFSVELYGRMASLGAEMSIASDEANLRISNMKGSILSYLADNGFVDNVGKSTVTNSSTAVQSAEYNQLKLKRDVDAFKQGLLDIETAYNKSVELSNKIRAKYTYKDIFGNTVSRPIPDTEQAILDAEFARQIKLRTMGSSYVTNAYAEVASISKNSAVQDLVMDNGQLPTNRQMNRRGLFMKWVFDDVLDGSVGSDELVNSIASQIPVVGDILNLL